MKEKQPALIAKGCVADLLFKVDVKRPQASDSKVIVAISFQRNVDKDKGEQATKLSLQLSMALCLIFKHIHLIGGDGTKEKQRDKIWDIEECDSEEGKKSFVNAAIFVLSNVS